MTKTAHWFTCSAAACTGGSANLSSRWRISPNLFATIRPPRRPLPALATPIDAGSYNNRGNVWQEMKDNERAIADYDMSIKLDPNYATAYYNRGNSRLETGDKEGAVADYRQAAKLNPSLKQASEML